MLRYTILFATAVVVCLNHIENVYGLKDIPEGAVVCDEKKSDYFCDCDSMCKDDNFYDLYCGCVEARKCCQEKRNKRTVDPSVEATNKNNEARKIARKALKSLRTVQCPGKLYFEACNCLWMCSNPDYDDWCACDEAKKCCKERGKGKVKIKIDDEEENTAGSEVKVDASVQDSDPKKTKSNKVFCPEKAENEFCNCKWMCTNQSYSHRCKCEEGIKCCEKYIKQKLQPTGYEL